MLVINDQSRQVRYVNSQQLTDIKSTLGDDLPIGSLCHSGMDHLTIIAVKQNWKILKS